MSPITTHVLDTSAGRPARGVRVTLERNTDQAWTHIGSGETDADGRLRTLLPAGAALNPGMHRLTFETKPYFAQHALTTFYPHVVVVFEVVGGDEHYHVPLLISPFGYSTYRGS